MSIDIELVLRFSFPILCLSVFMGAQCSNLHFSYYPNITNEYEANFLYSQDSNLAGGALQVTLDSRNSLLMNQAGRVVHREKLMLWRDKKTEVASFNSTFVLNILPQTNPGGEGLAFILTPNISVPNNSFGRWLGIVNKEINGSPLNQIVAIEFDTRKSYSGDTDSNHVGVDVNSISSIFQFPLDRSIVNLSSGMDVLVKISYDGKLAIMTVDLSMGNGTVSGQPSLSFLIPLNLTDYLPQDVHVGFSASTSNFTQLNCVRSWNFTSTSLSKGRWWSLKWVLPVSIGGGTLLAAGLIVLACYACRQPRRQIHIDRNGSSIDLSSIEGSKQFRYRELKNATSDFDDSRILGRGGYGIVYRGVLKGIEVAVKKFLMNSCPGEKEFFSELTTIGHINHPNLVKLIGWCRERGELLLVYEYMPNKSLDKHLFCNESSNIMLSWVQRLKILKDVASALTHLHDERQHNLIFHKDVKSSNIMLDSEFNAYLGDFGLARTVQEGNSHHTTKEIAGTACYVAPEYCQTGQASIKTDVYAFGALAAEVCCGEKPTVNHTIPWNNSVINRVMELYKEDKILEAADPRLGGDFDQQQMEGVLKLALLCCQLKETHRPTSSLVLKILMGEANLPDLPEENPSAVTDATSVSTASSSRNPRSLQDFFDEENGIGFVSGELTGR